MEMVNTCKAIAAKIGGWNDRAVTSCKRPLINLTHSLSLQFV